jgi:hypothetical protein
LPRRSGEAHLYRLNHPLAEAVLEQVKARDLPPVEICFDYRKHSGKVSLLEPLVGKSGWLALSLLSVDALDQSEDHLIFAGLTDFGVVLDEQVMLRMLSLPGTIAAPLTVPERLGEALKNQASGRQAVIQKGISERNAQFFAAEADKLDGWADDLKLGLERELKELDRQIKEARRGATTTLTLDDKLTCQKQIRALESERNEKRRSLFEAQDKVDKQRDDLISQIEGTLSQRCHTQVLFLIHWSIA